jgi:hypothetical protein
MNVEAFVICDFAQDNNGKLTIIGTFDTLNAHSFPVVHPYMSIALRMRFLMHELGRHNVRIELKDPDGELLMKPFETQVNVVNIGTDSATAGLVINHFGVGFKTHGKHEVKLIVDGEPKSSIPLYVRQVVQQQ